ncbi:MAG: preprotein translocase subunit SecE [Pseudomonadota bacterium]|nr:preprotein translocase subunit SecE [Pseudomonadota bacterium]
MNSKLEQTRSANAADMAKYALAIAVALAGVVGFYWFDQWPTALRALVLAAGLLIAAALFLLATSKGEETREFLSEARFELRKVVWPTRQEAMRTTWIVMLAVVVISLILAGFDVVIQFFVKLILGQ